MVIYKKKFEFILRHLTWCTLCEVVEITSKLQSRYVRAPQSLAKEEDLSTVCDMVEISSKL